MNCGGVGLVEIQLTSWNSVTAIVNRNGIQLRDYVLGLRKVLKLRSVHACAANEVDGFVEAKKF